MAICALLLIDKPSQHSVVPMVVGQTYGMLKLGTQLGNNLTPDKFFYARTLLCMYNLAFLIAVWYKLRQARREKLDLEYNFFVRIDSVMTRMSYLFEGIENEEAA